MTIIHIAAALLTALAVLSILVALLVKAARVIVEYRDIIKDTE